MCKECSEEKVRKIFLDDLPRNGEGINKGKIDWKESANQHCKVNFIYDDIKGNIEILDYKKENQKILIKYLDKEEVEIHTGSFSKCMIGRVLGKITKDFKIEIGTIFKDDKRDLIITDRKYTEEICGVSKVSQKYYRYTCNKCKWEDGWLTEGNLMNNKIGCSCCCGRVTVPEINSIVANEETHWMIPYFQGGYDEAKMYTKGSISRIFPICPDCGRVRTKSIKVCDIYSWKSIGCACGDGFSIPEKIIFNILEQLSVGFIKELTKKNLKWCGKYRYDFYIKDKNVIIEADGRQHKKEQGIYSNWNMSLKEQIKNDAYKDKLAKEHGIKVIRIDCEFSNLKFIKNNILKSELNNIFDLSKIDWSKCERSILKNLCKEVCEIKRDNPDMTTVEIGKIKNVHYSTIIRYLKQGNNIWDWCNYNAKEEMKKSNGKNGRLSGKQVEIFKDGISLGIFPSCHELERQSEKLFGVKIKTASISLICLGKQKKTHKGYTFKYVENKYKQESEQ